MGTYYYDRVNQPNPFEAVFVEGNGAVEGSILDDGRLGEAKVSGTFAYPNLTFVKRYYGASLDPVKYEGTMSEDGNKLTGRWRISPACHGTWNAWRIDGEEEEEETTEEEAEIEVPQVQMVRRSR